MSLTVSFTCSQSASNPAAITITDTSTGSDVLVTQRRIYFTDSEGNAVVPAGTTTSYVAWSYSDVSITVTLLTEDMALNVIVQWLDVSNTVLYTDNDNFCFSEFNQQYFYSLIQQQALSPSIIQDTPYYTNLSNYWVNITGAIQAIEIGNDLSASQNCLNAATNLMNNAAAYF